jgi:glycoprotein endo-alpha-1,2-mannosidase
LALVVLVACGGLAPEAPPPVTKVELGGEEEAMTRLWGAYYYPWHAGDFHGRQYLRERLVPPQAPELGEYDDRDAAVIGQHLAWSRDAGLGLWVTSWWGPGSREDETTQRAILTHPELDDFRIAVLYETTGRTRDFTNYTAVGPDVAYLARTYFDHPNYLRIDGRPVLFVYLTRVLEQRGELEAVLTSIREAAAAEGHAVFVVGDHVFGRAPGGVGQMALLDGVTGYDVYGSMGVKGYASRSQVDAYFAQQARWRTLAQGARVAFVPAVTPGFNDTAVRAGHAPLSRQLGPEAEFGSLFQAMLEGAVLQADPRAGGMVLVTSWNEWHEDTQIEPVATAAATRADDSESGSAYTTGLAYEGYAMRYLEILRAFTGR